MNLRASGSIPAEGSSKRIIGGLPRIAMATDSFLLLPPDKVPEGFFLCSARLKSSIALSMAFYLNSIGIPLILA
jgi:hypothetical protein